MSRPARTRSPMHAVRRGLTFIEIICAVTMLSLAAAAMLSASSAIVSAQSRGLKRLGAAELANRLMLQYLDDEDSLPSTAAPIEYGVDTYRWSKRVSPITMESTIPQDPTRGAGTMGLDRLRAVTFTVWLTDEARGQTSAAEGAPSFTLTRIVDPIFGQLRNPDTRERIMSDPVLRQRFIDMITGRGGGSTAPAPTPRGGANPTPTGGGKK